MPSLSRSGPLSLGNNLGFVADAWTVQVRAIASFPAPAEFARSVFLVDCVWELFVLVGNEARSKRLEIRLALAVAEVCRLVRADRNRITHFIVCIFSP